MDPETARPIAKIEDHAEKFLPLETPFGPFYGPNITADKQYGIGSWSEAEFRRALRRGTGREGEHLFPVFPVTSFTGISDEDCSRAGRSRSPTSRMR